MASNMAWKVGKGAFQKFNGKTFDQDPTITSVDHAHYRGPLIQAKKVEGQLVFTHGKFGKKHRKDSAYYEYKGIPEKDAKILSLVVANARFLDNGIRIPLVGYKIGANTFIELIPALGDFAGTGLSIALVLAPALRVSKGTDGADKKKLKRRMILNVTMDCCIGLVPLAGDLVDTMIKYNVRNAELLETMLLKRAAEAATMGRDAEKVGRTTGHLHAGANGHHLAAANQYHDFDPPHDLPKRFLNAKDLSADSKPAASARMPVVQTQPKKSSGNFFRHRGRLQGDQEVGTTMEEVTPVLPLRPEPSRHERGGYF